MNEVLLVTYSAGRLEVNWAWLPSWIGLNARVMEALGKDLQTRLADVVLNQVVSPAVLRRAHEIVIDVLCEKYPEVHGLRDYLESLKFVRV